MTAFIPGDRKAPWLSELPSDWPLAPLKYETGINLHKLPDATDPEREIEYIDIGRVSSYGEIQNTERMVFGEAPSRARRLPKSGDTIASTVRTYLRAIAYIENAHEDLVCSTGFAVLSPGRHLSPKFLFYWMRSAPVVDEICARSVGVSYPAINPSDFTGVPLPVISLAKQQAIADFLDRKTAAIDELIAKKERLIELLQEKRQALITQAVTKGLDPNVPMKDSGIEWLGQIPAHWICCELKRKANRVVVGIAEAATHAYCDVGVPIVRSTNVRKNVLETGDLLHVQPWFAAERRSKTVRAGDLLTQRTGEESGTTAVVPEELDGCQCFTMVITTLQEQMDSQFVSYAINSEVGWAYFDQTRWGSAQPNISVPIVKEIPLAAPPYAEQVAIRRYIEEQGQSSIEGRVLKQIELLREYRQALITEAVTGKLDIAKAEAA